MGRTVFFGDFEWDMDKARQNLRKHGVSFEEATRVFFDPHFFEVLDEEHSTATEQRFVGYGVITWRGGRGNCVYRTRAYAHNIRTKGGQG